MTLLFDLRATQPNLSGKRHGGGRYGEVIFHRMVERGIAFSAFYDSRLWLNPDVKAAAEKGGIQMLDVAHRSVQQLVDEGAFDRVYSCLMSLDVAYLQRCKVIGTIHGLRNLETPWDRCFWSYRNPVREQVKHIVRSLLPGYWRERMLRKIRRLYVESGIECVVVSEHTRYAVQCFCPELRGREMPVFFSPNTSLGVKREEEQAMSEERPEPVGERYFLAVSANRWEKNVLRAIEAFDRLKDAALLPPDVRMKVTGARRDNFRQKLRHPEAFDFLGYVSDQELERLYAGAYLFVYPSLNEGFGYPPLEAMRYSVPVIASPLSSIAEILDQGALYFNPFLVEEIMNRMLMMLSPSRHAAFAQRGHERYLEVSARQRRDLDGVIDYLIGEK